MTSSPTINRREFLKRSCVAGIKLSIGGSALVAAGHSLVPGAALAATQPSVSPATDSVDVDATAAIAGGKTGAAPLDPRSSRRLHLVNAHTWDDIDVVYFTQGIYIDENIAHLNHLMRDRRANVATSMDTDLYDQLLRLQMVLGTNEAVHVLSGYRTPETNARLRRRSSGVAKYSLHMEGRAADIYIPGIPVKQVQAAALELHAGGVGLYSKSNFVHMDTGTVRHWGG